MTTYSFIQYDVLNNLMSFKGTPTPGLKTLIKDNNSDISSIRDILQNDQYADDTVVPTAASSAIISFLEATPEIDLANSKTIILTIEIIDDTSIGNTVIVSKNLDGTKTTVTKGGLTLAVENIKPKPKWPTLGKCGNCLKFDFLTGSNAYNFYGSLGGSWTGGFKNNQKEYSFFLPDYSNPLNYGILKEYIIYWKPSVNYSGTDYDGNAISIVNQNKWVAVPSSSINGPFTTESFFHVTSGVSASCPVYNDTPLTPPWYNFYGKKGYFLTSTPTNQLPGKPCPTFTPIPGAVSWGYYCGPSGCVPAPSGSISGSIPANWYATFDQCNVSCSLPPTSSWYICTQNDCIPVPAGTSGAFTSLAECEAKCVGVTPVTTCSCDPDLNLITNPDFSSGPTGWSFTPPQFTPGVGSWDFSQGYALGSSNLSFSTSNTSSVSLTQANVFTISCSYRVCFQAWNDNLNNPLASVSVNTGNSTTNLPQITTLTSTPTAYTFTLNNVETTNLTFFIGSLTFNQSARIAIDNVCVTLIGCPPPNPPTTGSEGTGSIPPEDCYVTGSIYSYVSASYDCLCPQGYVSNGSGSCIGSTSSTLNAIAAITASIGSNNAAAFSTTPVLGYSILQNPTPQASIGGWDTPKAAGLLQPILYYDWNFNGTGDSSVGNQSPFSGSSFVYNTQYTFDILSSSFWNQPTLPDNSGANQNSITAFPMRWVAGLIRNTQIGNYFSTLPINYMSTQFRWTGMGTTLNPPTNKTYYVGIIGQGAMQIKLDGNTILRTSPSALTTPPYNVLASITAPPLPLNYPPLEYPAYVQNMYARLTDWPNSPQLYGVLPSPIFSSNPYLNANLQGPCIDYIFQAAGIECSPYAPTFQWGKLSSVYNLYIYPVTMSAGCHKINFESSIHETSKYCNSTQGGFGAIIFDMTAAQLVSASNYNDLNIVWDSTQLSPIDYNGVYNGAGKPRYMYSYGSNFEPSASYYTSLCPTGSTPVGGNPCLGCITSGSSVSTIPCGNCLECTHGLLYNGYVVDKGSATLQGRGPGGIVNTGSINATTWVIPTESDWNNLVTFLNNGVAPTSVTITGSLGTIAGGKLKDYTRDLEATCWESPNLGAQTNASSSGWAGTAGGRRKDNGVFEGLGFEGLWWSANSLSTPPIQNGALMAARRLEHYSPDVYRDIFPKSYGCSIRLVRPAATGEVNGMFIPDAYVGKNGTIYDGVVINDQVWIDKNLSETLYNNGTLITTTIPNNTWSSTPTVATATSCYYNNDATNANIINGNINPVTQECYTFPTYYVYEKCDGSEFLVQPVSGSTTTVGKVLKDSNNDCWSYFDSSEGIPTYPHTYSSTNHFSGSNVIYNNCNECEAIHTIYMKFGTKNC
jgi:hypothetical protein